MQRVLRLGGGWAPIKLTPNPSATVRGRKAVSEFIGSSPDRENPTRRRLSDHTLSKVTLRISSAVHVGPGQSRIPENNARSAPVERNGLQRGFHSGNAGLVASIMPKRPPVQQYHIWLGQIKEKFDPNHVFDPPTESRQTAKPEITLMISDLDRRSV
jgi:hypothetical protein